MLVGDGIEPVDLLLVIVGAGQDLLHQGLHVLLRHRLHEVLQVLW